MAHPRPVIRSPSSMPSNENSTTGSPSRWTLPSRLAENPLVWMIPVNGVIVDMRMVPRELQEQAYELGLIPFVPARRGATDGAR